MSGEMLYNFPAMLELAAELETENTSLQALAKSIEVQQRVLGTVWQGQASEAYQSWQQQWNFNNEQLSNALNAISQILTQNTLFMQGFEAHQTAVWS